MYINKIVIVELIKSKNVYVIIFKPERAPPTHTPHTPTPTQKLTHSPPHTPPMTHARNSHFLTCQALMKQLI